MRILTTGNKAQAGLVPGHRVLLVHASPERREQILGALPEHGVTAVATVEEALAELASAAPDLVISTADGARRLLRALESSAPSATRLFLCAMTDVEAVKGLLELAAEGHLFVTLDEGLPSDEMGRRLRQILFGRASGRVLPSGNLEAIFELEGVERRFEVSDVSSNGIGLKVDADSEVAKLTPGSDLVHLRVEGGGRVILRADRAYLRHFRFDETAAEPFFHVGVAFPESRESDVGTLINDPMRVMGLLRRAVARRGHLRVKSWSDRSRTYELNDYRLSPVGNHLVLHGNADGCVFGPGDVVQLIFEVSGLSHSGLAAIAPFLPSKPGRIAMFVPKAVTVRHRRGRARFRVTKSNPFALSFTSPVTGERLVRPVLDLQTKGLSFAFDASREAFPPGLVIDDLDLTLPDGTMARCTGTVRDSGPLTANVESFGFASARRCGVSLGDVPLHAREAILDAFVAARSPSIRVANREAFSDAWGVVRSADGFYPDYPLESGPHLATLENTYQRIHQSGEGLGKTLLSFDGEQPVGHASGLRYYSRTWVLQHLAVRPTFTRDRFTGRDLSSLIVEYAEILEDVEWVRKIWNIRNRWVNRLGGWVARSMLTQGLCQLRSFNFMHAPLAPSMIGSSLPIRGATSADLQWLERHLTRSGQSLRLRSDDLSAEEFDLRHLSARFEPHGLYRRRRMFVADGGQPVMALVEESSPGMHWGEFTNAFSLVGEERTPESNERRAALALHCLKHYQQAGRSSAVALVDDQDVGILEGLGFSHLGKFAEFTFHRSTIQNWIQLSSALFERLQRAMEKTVLREVEPNEHGPGMGPISGITPIIP